MMSPPGNDSPVPYVGLRPFDFEEAALFYGRGEHIAEMVRTLRKSNFLAVMGSSGSGKSSLVRAGLLPAIADGCMNGSEEDVDWRFVMVRPGLDPYENLLSELLPKLAPGQTLDPATIDFRRQTLRGGPRGLVEAFTDSLLPESTRLVVLIDQFEEIFRFLDHRGASKASDFSSLADRRNAAIAFVDMLLATAAERDPQLYVVLTMRSEYLGECEAFLGLSAAIAKSQFLTPRMTRDQIQDIIKRPIAAVGGQIDAQVVTNLLNSLGTAQDQLPRVEHILLQMWSEANDDQKGQPDQDEPVLLTLEDYRSVGGFESALNQHAEQLYKELGNSARIGRQSEKQRVAEEMFRSLADRSSQGALIRRLSSLGEVASIAGVSEEIVAEVVEHFRQPGCNFLVATPSAPLTGKTTLDISHEALLRQWHRLGSWVEKEANSADMYRRLADTAEREGSLWRDRDLELALKWRDQKKPTMTWAERYQPGFEEAMTFLRRSEQQRDTEFAESEIVRRLGIATKIITVLFLILLFGDPFGLEREVVDDYYIMRDVKKALRAENIVVLPDIPGVEIDNLETSEKKAIGHSAEEEIVSDVEKAGSSIRNHDAAHIKYAIEGHLRRINRALVLPMQDSDHDKLSKEPRSRVKGTGKEANQIQSEHDKFSKEMRSRVKSAIAEANKTRNRREREPESIFVVVEEDLEITKTQEDAQVVSPGTQMNPWQSWEAVGVVVLTKREFPTEPDFVPLHISPSLIDAVLKPDKQTLLIKRLLTENQEHTGLQKKLLQDPEKIPPIVRVFQILLYLLGYLTLIAGFEFFYRRFVFQSLVETAGSALEQSALKTSKHTFSHGVARFLQRFKSPLWKVVFLVALVFIALLSLYFDVWLGLMLILLIPVEPLSMRPWARRFKAAQGMLLQVGGYFSLAGGVYLFGFTEPGYVLQRVLLPIWNPWVLLIVGIGMVILGRWKYVLAIEETIVREPGQVPILYLQSAEVEDGNGITPLNTWPGRFFKPNDEDFLRPIFGALGRFIPLHRAEQLLGYFHAVDGSAGKQEMTDLMDRSALVIMQVDEFVTEDFYSRLKQACQTLRPDQVLLYFSMELTPGRFSTLYRNFVETTQDIFPCPLPKTMGANRVIAFNKDWQPFLCGVLTRLGISWRHLIPMLGRRLEFGYIRHSFAETLAPFFKGRNMLPSQFRLFSDQAIRLASFPPLGLGVPAGVMMFSNLWRTGRKRAAVIGLFAPTLGIIALSIWFVLGFVEHNLELEGMAFAILVFFGYPFAVIWLWRRLSGREIRRHIAFGGARQSGWKALLVLLIGGFLGLVLGFLGVPLLDNTLSSASSEVTVTSTRDTDNCDDDSDYQDVTDKVIAPNGHKVKLGYEMTFLRFTPSTPGAYQFDLVAEDSGYQRMSVDPRIAIYSFTDEDCEFIYDNDDAHYGLNSRLSWPLEATTYLIGVQSVSGEGEARLSVTQGNHAKDSVTQGNHAKDSVTQENYTKATAKLNEGYQLVEQDRIYDAVRAFKEALQLDKSLDHNADYCNDFAWYSLQAHSLEVGLSYSEMAVEMGDANNDENILSFRDTRGVARALTGDPEGAIKDFRAVLGSDVSNDYRAQLQGWVDKLEDGQSLSHDDFFDSESRADMQ